MCLTFFSRGTSTRIDSGGRLTVRKAASIFAAGAASGAASRSKSGVSSIRPASGTIRRSLTGCADGLASTSTVSSARSV